jgi:hypothetical protein
MAKNEINNNTRPQIKVEFKALFYLTNQDLNRALAILIVYPKKLMCQHFFSEILNNSKGQENTLK